MNHQQEILESLNALKATSQNPISASLLVGKHTFLEITEELDRMYTCTPAMVNRAKIIKGDESYMAYWPTGMIKAFTYTETSRQLLPTKVLREEMQAQPLQQETIIMTEIFNETDPTELKLLSYIKANPQCTLSRAERETKTSINTACSYLKWFFEQEYLTKEKFQNTNLIQFADKADQMTAKQLYDLHQKEKPATGRKPKPAIIKTKEEAFEIPAFLKKSNQETVAVAETKPAELKAKPATDEGDFKIAYTSNGTLIFYGIHSAPIELSVKQTHLLNNFMNESVVIE